MSNTQPLDMTEAGAICTLTLNTPKNYNALSEEMLDALATAQAHLREREDLSVVIVAANGRAFCAGHDLKQMQSQRDADYYQRLFSQCGEIMDGFARLPQVSIAKVQGIATAAGCQLVASCDLAVAQSDAKFAVSGINLGLFCSTPAVALSRNLGRKQALQMLMTGEFISAQQAQTQGLINSVVEPALLDSAVSSLADNIASKPAVAIHTGKRLFQAQMESTQKDAYTLAAKAMADNIMHADAEEGIQAFLEKRPPNWHKTH